MIIKGLKLLIKMEEEYRCDPTKGCRRSTNVSPPSDEVYVKKPVTKPAV